MKKLNLLPIVFLGFLCTTSTVQAEEVALSGNVGIMSNYIYRGMTQTDNKASAKVGLNAFYNGFYAGSTVLAVDFDTDDNFEIDYFAGYTNSLNIFTYDLNVFVTSYDGSTEHSTEVALGLSWPCQLIDDLTLGLTYSKGIDEAPSNFNMKASYDLKILTLDADYNNYDTVGNATTIGILKSFQMSKYAINTALKYSSFSSDNLYITDQDNLYFTAEITF